MKCKQKCMCGNCFEIDMTDIGVVDDFYFFWCDKCNRSFEYQYHDTFLVNIKEVCGKTYKVKIYCVISDRNTLCERIIQAKDVDTVEWIVNQLYHDVRTIEFTEEWAKEEYRESVWSKCESLV
jgi:hypothetical protein